jgi:hypothetical protein
MTVIKPIETRYAGCRFRSRLEARYAVFLDALGLRWEYEPEGFELPSGWYLPDFYLPTVCGGSWIEVKPYGQGTMGWACLPDYQFPPRWEDKQKFYEFTDLVSENFFVANGLPDPVILSCKNLCYSQPGMLEAAWDPHFWCVCGCGVTPGIEFDGRGDRVFCDRKECKKSAHGDKGYSHNSDIIIRAAEAAKSARFEHHEARHFESC